MAELITDPGLLQQLDGSPASAPVRAPQEITDPDIIKQLEAPQSLGERAANVASDAGNRMWTGMKETAKSIPLLGRLVPQSPDMTQYEQEHPAVTAINRAGGAAAATAPIMAAGPIAGAVGLGSLNAADTAAGGGSTGDILREGGKGLALGAVAPMAGWAAGKVAGPIADFIGGMSVPDALKGLSSASRKALVDSFAREGLSQEQAEAKLADIAASGKPLSEFGPETARTAKAANSTIEAAKDAVAYKPFNDPGLLQKGGELLSHLYNPEVAPTQLVGLAMKGLSAGDKGLDTATQLAKVLANTGIDAQRIGTAAATMPAPYSTAVAPTTQALVDALLKSSRAQSTTGK